MPRWLLGLVVAGAAIRLLLRWPGGEEAFVRDGYTVYLTLSQNFLDGLGLCYAAGQGCAVRVPVYPLMLSAFTASGLFYPAVVIAQAIIGSAVAWVTWLVGCELFDRRVGAAAAVAAAFSPYALIHDTALQDTVVVNFLLALSVFLFLAARQTARASLWTAAGAALGLAVLTSARVAVFVPLVIMWVALTAGDSWRTRMRQALTAAVPLVVLLGGWTVRNWQVVGAPVLTTEAGESLWFGNNPWTFTYFPEQSIDLVTSEFDRLPASTRATIDSLEHREVERDAALGQLARDYIVDDPARTMAAAARKVWSVASAQLSPARGRWVQAGYLAAYLPIHVLALVGFWRARATWRAQGPAWLLAVALLVTTAAFWAHTSHKTYLDPILFVYAAAALL